MKTSNTNTVKLGTALVSVLLLVLSLNVYASDAMNPYSDEESVRISSYAGLSLTQLPRIYLRDEVSKVPMLEAGLKVQLPSNLVISSYLSSCYLINSLTVAMEYVLYSGDVTLSVGDQSKAWLGVAKMENFNVLAYGLYNTPYVRSTMKLGDYKLGLKAGLDYNLLKSYTVGNDKVNKPGSYLSGVSGEVTIEQPLSSNLNLMLGANINYSMPVYEMWMAFESSSRMMVYPKLMLGLSF